jgi:hypothetical protein
MGLPYSQLSAHTAPDWAAAHTAPAWAAARTAAKSSAVAPIPLAALARSAMTLRPIPRSALVTV